VRLNDKIEEELRKVLEERDKFIEEESY